MKSLQNSSTTKLTKTATKYIPNSVKYHQISTGIKKKKPQSDI